MGEAKLLMESDVHELVGMMCVVEKTTGNIKAGSSCEIIAVDASYNHTLKVRDTKYSYEANVRIESIRLSPRNPREFKAELSLAESRVFEIQEKIEFLEEMDEDEFNEDAYKVHKITKKIMEAKDDKETIRRTIAEIIL